MTVNGTTTVTGTFTVSGLGQAGDQANLNATINAATVTGDAITVNVDDAPSGQIQDGVDVAASGATVNVLAGTYTENLTIPKSLTLTGAGEADTKIIPAVSSVGLGIDVGTLGGSTVILVDANNVTVQNLTIDGDNPTLPSGNPAIGGADIDAQTGIVTNFNRPFTYTGMTVKNVTVQNIFLRGIEFADGGDNGNGEFDFEYNTVANVQGDDIDSAAIFNSGGNGTIFHNKVSDTPSAIVTDQSFGTDISVNTITNSALAIQSDNNGNLGGASVADSIHDNIISQGSGALSYGILVFVPRKAVTVQNNMIDTVDVGVAAWGGSSTGSAAFSDNTVGVMPAELARRSRPTPAAGSSA